MSTSSRQTAGEKGGFSLVELLVGLALALALISVAAPVFLALASRANAEADGVVEFMQGRVAVARLERDLRMASAGGALLPSLGPILEAEGSQVVFLKGCAGGSPPLLVEWELVHGALMRRVGDCTTTISETFAHSLYRDNKTLLEGVAGESAFLYLLDDQRLVSSVPEQRLPDIEAVILEAQVKVPGMPGHVRVWARAWVGR